MFFYLCVHRDQCGSSEVESERADVLELSGRQTASSSTVNPSYDSDDAGCSGTATHSLSNIVDPSVKLAGDTIKLDRGVHHDSSGRPDTESDSDTRQTPRIGTWFLAGSHD